MTWSRCFKRVFDIDTQTREACGGTVRVIAAIEDPVVIRKMLDHLDRPDAMPLVCHRPAARAPFEAAAGAVDAVTGLTSG